VNFCKFTNETRNGLEDSSKHSGLKFLAAVNGACAGGGYELALACDEIILVDDRSSAVSLPEVPLLGVLPGTGGLTRVTDKRKVRHDLADIFCTTTEGVRGQKAKDWRLVDDIAKPAQFAAKVQERALAAGRAERPPGRRQGRGADAAGSAPSRPTRCATAHVTRRDRPRQAHRHLHRQGARRRAADRHRRHRGRRRRLVPAGDGARAGRRDPVDAHQRARHRHLADEDRGRCRRRAGDGRHAAAHQDHWLVRETIGLLRRTFSRLDVSSRSLFALIEPGSCFAGSCSSWRWPATAATCWRCPTTGEGAEDHGGDANFGLYPMVTGQSRLAAPLLRRAPALDAVRAQGRPAARRRRRLRGWAW
jgi:benzoyl-CoA-dihydrodiol lyase